MSLDLRITIQESSPVARVLLRMVAEQHITPEQAVTRILDEAVSREGAKTPAEELIGAFSSAEDQEIMERAMASAKLHRRQFDTVRDLGF